MTDDEAEKLLGLIKGHCARLRADFDHVQIFAAKFTGQDGTRHWSYGEGDWLGRYGHISIWLERERAAEWAKEMKEV